MPPVGGTGREQELALSSPVSIPARTFKGFRAKESSPALSTLYVYRRFSDLRGTNTYCSALNEQEHFRGGSGSEAYSSNIDDRSFHEDQLWPFAESVKAGVGSVMCAYSRVNQTYSCENRRLLNDIIKEELDFQVSATSVFIFIFLPGEFFWMRFSSSVKGFMLSDWAAVESSIASVMNGVDVNMPGVYIIIWMRVSAVTD